MSVILFCLLCALLFSSGVSLCLWLGVKKSIEIWGLSWLLGMGWGSFSWFLGYYWFNQPFTLLSLFGVLLGINILGWVPLSLFRRAYTIKLLNSFWHDVQFFVRLLMTRKQQTLLKLGVFILAVLCLFTVVQDIFWPVTDWDALALYDFRAKVMVTTGSLAQGKQLEYFFQYPLFTSALHAATYFTGLGTAKIWYALIYQAMLCLFYAVLRKKTTVGMSMTGTVFLASTPLIFSHALIAYTNLAYTAYSSLGFMYLWQWWRDERTTHVLAGAMLVGLSTWVRISEPFYFIAAALVLMKLIVCVKRRTLTFQRLGIMLCALGCILLTRWPWDSLITSLYGLNVNTPLASFFLVKTWDVNEYLGRVSEVSVYLWNFSVSVFAWQVALASLLLISDLKRKHWDVLVSWVTLLFLLSFIFMGTLLLSFSLESWNRIGDSVARMSLFLVPLWLYVIFVSPSWLHPVQPKRNT